jgi:hypothetical protein
MIAELAAANAAFGVIKEAIANGKELYEAGEALADYFGLKAQIQKRAHEHGYKSDLEAFMAAEQLKEQEQALKNMLIWQGKPGQWDRFLEHQKMMKESRLALEQEEKAKKLKRKRLLKDIALGTVLTLLLLTGVGFIGYVMYWVATQ